MKGRTFVETFLIMMNVILPEQLSPQKLIYDDIIKVSIDEESKYYLLVQSGPAMLILIEIADFTSWNRETDPVLVVWSALTTESIKKYFPQWKRAKIEKIKYKFTFEIM